MRRRIAALLVSVAAVAALACASTSMRSQVDPALRGRVFRKVAVVADFVDLRLRQDAEQECVRSLASRGVQGVASGGLLFPGRDYTREEVQRVLTEASADAVLLLTPAGAGSSSMWIPPTTTTQGTATVVGNTATGSATTRTSGGYSMAFPWAKFQAELVDRSTQQVVWVASFESEGNALAEPSHLVRSMARKAAGALVDQGLLK